jgi:hypothetical protein
LGRPTARDLRHPLAGHPYEGSLATSGRRRLPYERSAHKVFRKLGISSRMQLQGVVPGEHNAI